MARTVTLASLRTQAIQRADMENSQFLSTAEWNLLINASATELYDLLVTAYEDYYATTFPITTTGTNSYSLPGDFYKLLGVDEGLTPNQFVTCKPYNFAERNFYTPFRDSNRVLTMTYIPACPVLAADADTFDGVNGWEEYIVVDAAKKAKQKQEDDTADLERDLARLTKRINDSAPNRDAGMGDRVTDIYHVDPFNDLYLTSRIRYRVLGNQINFVSYQTAFGVP